MSSEQERRGTVSTASPPTSLRQKQTKSSDAGIGVSKSHSKRMTGSTTSTIPEIRVESDPVIAADGEPNKCPVPYARGFQKQKHRPPPTLRIESFFPKPHKAKVIVWADLTVDAVDRLNESLNADHIKQVLADIFELDNFKDNLKTGIKMDLFYYTLQFAREQKFSPEKTSAFFSIIKKIFEVCIETPYGNLDHTFKYFKDLLLCHSVNRPPYSIELFSPHEVRKITEYTINTFFRHFKMYKYAFTPMVRLDLAINYVGMPPSPPPSESEFKGSEVPGDDGAGADDGDKAEEIDEERLAAREELKGMVKDFLATESKRIEGSVEQHLKSAVASLNTQIDNMLETNVPEKGKKKK